VQITQFKAQGYVILTLYMGLRPESEVKRITWKNINFKTGKLFEQTGKSHLGRRLEIPQNALDLLRMCKRKKGDIIESNYEHKKIGTTCERELDLL
jgi:integrase